MPFILRGPGQLGVRLPLDTCDFRRVLARDVFLIREFIQATMLSHLFNELLEVVPKRPLESVAVNLGRYSVGYSCTSLLYGAKMAGRQVTYLVGRLS